MFERPEYAVLGRTGYDQNWIDSNTEAGVAACGWQRPKPRPQGLDKATGGKRLGPAKTKRSGLISRIKRAVLPSAHAPTSAPAATSTPEMPSVPAEPAKPRDPVDELLEPSDAPPAKLQPRRCWWC